MRMLFWQALGLLSLAAAAWTRSTSHRSLSSRAVAFPLHTSSRWILDANNERVKLRCANWAGHLEVNIPEGLSHRTPQDLASWLADNGFNCVRLTYSIDMALNPDQSISDSFTNAALSTGTPALSDTYNTAVSKNPWLASSTTRDAFGEVITALGQENIMVVLDNHVSKASWCCNLTDGNGWFKSGNGDINSRYFDVDNWINGLKSMATFANDYPNIIGMSLRNELRPIALATSDIQQEWTTRVQAASSTIHSANPSLLIMIGGIASALDLSWLSSDPLDRSQFPDRVVWEVHWYSWSYLGITDCALLKLLVGRNAGFLLTQNKAYTGPLWLSEFGIGLNGISDSDRTFLQCVVDYATGNDMEWAIWALQGSYYARDGTLNYDESFGLLTSDWANWRNTEVKDLLGRMWEQTQGP